MRMLTQEEREQRAAQYPEGCRVRAVRFKYEPKDLVDDNITVPPGTEGTVSSKPDGAGSVPVNWDNGRGIGFLVEDQVERIN